MQGETFGLILIVVIHKFLCYTYEHSCATYQGLRWHCQDRLGTCWCYHPLSVESPLLLLHWHAHCSSTCTQGNNSDTLAYLWHSERVTHGYTTKFLHGKLTRNSMGCVSFHSPSSQVNQVDLADSFTRKVRRIGSLKDHHREHERIITVALFPGLHHLKYLIASSV